MDTMLPWSLLELSQLSVWILGMVIFVASVNPYIFVVLVPLAVAFWLLRYFYLFGARAVKRLEGVARSPVYSHVFTTLSGLPTIRSHGVVDRFVRDFEAHQDTHSQAYFAFVAVSRWLGIHLDMITFAFIALTSFGAVRFRDQLNAGEAGLSLIYVLSLTGLFQWCVRQSADVENYMTSAERVMEYTTLPAEPNVPEDSVSLAPGPPSKIK